MRSDGGRLLATSDQDPVITYSRISPEGERTEPRFAAPPHSARPLDGPQDLAEITAPPLFDDLPPEPPFGGDDLPRTEFRQARRARAPRLVAIAGVFAVLTGAGVLAATFGGIVHLDGARIAPDGSLGATTDVSAAGASGQAVRIVALPSSPTNNTAALLGGTVDVGLDTGVAPGRLIADPPLPRLRPATASANPPQPAAPADVATDANTGAGTNAATDMNPGADVKAAAVVNAGADAAVAVNASADPNAGTDVDSLLASVDRVIAEEKARAASMATPGVATSSGSLAGAPLAAGSPTAGMPGSALPGTGSPSASGPLPYPVLEPLPGADVTVNAGIDVAAVAPPPPYTWLLPKRRVFLVPVGPVPPADIPNAGTAY